MRQFASSILTSVVDAQILAFATVGLAFRSKVDHVFVRTIQLDDEVEDLFA